MDLTSHIGINGRLAQSLHDPYSWALIEKARREGLEDAVAFVAGISDEALHRAIASFYHHEKNSLADGYAAMRGALVAALGKAIAERVP